ncbi:MAG: hypothetical protein IV100_07300 [Myxococcales bacterium]|nr:hypothetical protein [Myxococcales bacterium]
MRLSRTFFLALAFGCSDEPEVVVGNANLPPGSQLEACVNGACPGGLECVENACRPPLVDPTPLGGDTGGTDDTALGPDANAAPDVTNDDTATPADDSGGSDGGTDVVAMPPDVKTPDTAGPIDTGDEPDVATLPDACDAPGQPSTCPTTPAFLYCRYEPSVKSLQCSAPTEPFASGQYLAPCTSNKDCDYSLGCHFGICTSYCELALQFCPYPGDKCMPIGSPKWGACQPPE